MSQIFILVRSGIPQHTCVSTPSGVALNASHAYDFLILATNSLKETIFLSKSVGSFVSRRSCRIGASFGNAPELSVRTTCASNGPDVTWSKCELPVEFAISSALNGSSPSLHASAKRHIAAARRSDPPKSSPTKVNPSQGVLRRTSSASATTS